MKTSIARQGTRFASVAGSPLVLGAFFVVCMALSPCAKAQCLPEITTQPSTELLCVEAISPAGAGALGYQWYVNGELVPGETEPCFGAGPTPFVPGAYTVHVFNLCGNVVSDSVLVTDVPPPPPNRPPSANNSSFTTLEDTTLADMVTGSDPDGDTITFSLDEDASHGLALVLPDGGFTYVSDANYFGPDTFTFRVDDGSASAIGTVSIMVVAVNDAPFTTPAALPDRITTVDTPITFSFLVNDVEDDAASMPLTVSVSANINPIITFSGLGLVRSGVNDSECRLTLTPLPGAVGEALISVVVTDSRGAAAFRSFRFSVVSRANNPPVAVINVSPDADLDEGDPEIILISVNGVDAPARLDGTASHDPDPGDMLAFSWFADSGSGPTPLGATAIVTPPLDIGDHQIVLSVSDGSLVAFTTERVTVIPVSEAIGYLIAEVESSSVREDWKRILATELRATSDLFAGRPPLSRLSPCAAGVGGLRVFRSSVRLLSEPRIGIIPRSLASEWIYLTDQIINSVTCP